MIEISTIAARKLPIPHGCEYHFIATASIGDSAVSTAPTKPVVDHRLGSSVTFREPLVLPCFVDGAVVDFRTFGVTIQIRSVCGTLHLGTAVCRVSKQWVPVIPTGEAMISFSMSESIPLPQTLGTEGLKRQRPATAGPPTRVSDANVVRRAANEEQVPVTSEYSGSLALRFKSISGLAISTTAPVSLYIVAQFATEELQSSTIEVLPESDGHRGLWKEAQSAVTFEVLPSNVSRILTLSAFGAWVKSGSSNFVAATRPHHLLGIAKVDVPTNLGGENQQFSSAVGLSGHPRSRLELDVALTYLKPRKEGAGGRPLSAYPRRNPATSSSGEHLSFPRTHPTLASPPKAGNADDDDDGDDGAVVTSEHHPTGSASRLRSKVVAGKKAWGDAESPDGSASAPTAQAAFPMAALLAKLEESISTAVGAAASAIMERLSSLEQRVQRTEEMVSQLRPASHRPGSGYSGAKIPKAPSSLSGAASRPSSADSVSGGPGYDVSHSIVTESQLRAKFQEYDAKGRGYITVGQLVQFYRTNSAFGDDEDEAKVLKYLEYCGIRVRSSEGICFDDFAKVALKLAQR